MIIGGELNKSQLAELRRTLARADLPKAKRQRLLWRLAKYGLIASAKRNVRNQADPDGEAWPGRRTKRKGKMLRNLPKLLHIRDMPEISAVRVYLQEVVITTAQGCASWGGGIQPAKRNERQGQPQQRQARQSRRADGDTCAGETSAGAGLPGQEG